MKRIQKGDEVIVISGRSKGQRGNVLSVLTDSRLLVENVNMIKRHTKPDPQNNKPGGIIEKEGPIDSSNVMLFDTNSGKGSRVGFRKLDDGRKVRFFKTSNEVIDN